MDTVGLPGAALPGAAVGTPKHSQGEPLKHGVAGPRGEHPGQRAPGIKAACPAPGGCVLLGQALRGRRQTSHWETEQAGLGGDRAPGPPQATVRAL